MRSNDLGKTILNIDHLLIKGSWVSCAGWIFHTHRTILKIDFLAKKTKDHYLRFAGTYGIARPDVAKQYDTASANNSGFWVTCVLSNSNISEYLLEVYFANGESSRIDVTSFAMVRQAAQPRHRVWVRRVWYHIARCALRRLFRKLGEKACILVKNRNLKRFQISHMQQYARVGESSEIVLIVDHNLGGGANQYRERWIKEKQQDGKHVLLLCYDFASLSYHIQSSGKNGNELFALESVEAFSDMAKNIRFEEIFLNNVYSFDDPLAIVTLLPALKYSTGAKLGVAINDYYSICPSYTLLDYTNNRFCGVPEILRCQECLPSNHGYFSLVVDCKDIGLWRRTWGACLRSADKIICFSNSSIPILQRAYPDLDVAKCEVRPHAVDYLTQHRLVLHHQGPLNIGIVGTINTTHKGAHIVRQMAHLIKEQHLPARITVIGELEGETPQSVVEVTGRYEREHLPEVIEKSGANIFFLPSIIPETFSYVTEELIQLNLPLAVFDLGAPAERVKRYANGIIIHEVDAQHALQQLLAFHERQRQLNARGNI